MKKAKYFSNTEFLRCLPSCTIEDMEQPLLNMLDKARELAGIPFVLNSAYRSRSYELAHGRSGNSAHTRGLAVDVRCNTSANRYKIVTAAISAGFKRIGIGKTFVHLDTDSSLPMNVIFDYYES